MYGDSVISSHDQRVPTLRIYTDSACMSVDRISNIVRRNVYHYPVQRGTSTVVMTHGAMPPMFTAWKTPAVPQIMFLLQYGLTKMSV